MNVLLALSVSLPLRSTSFSPSLRFPLLSRALPGCDILRPTATVVGRSSSPQSSLLAAKRRRRRKAASPSPTTQAEDLPDFDDNEQVAQVSSVSSKWQEPAEASFAPTLSSKALTPAKRGSGLDAKLAEEVGGNVEGLDEDTIMEAMRGKVDGDNWQPPRSIQDTLSDRSLEKFMDFDKMIEQDGGRVGQEVELPDFDEVIARRKRRQAEDAVQEGQVKDAAMLIDTEGMGKKAARNAQRRAAAMQREIDIDEEKNPFENLNVLTLLENGAWVGIGLLVLWEIYINSPFFERAAPLIPVVYDEATPPGM